MEDDVKTLGDYISIAWRRKFYILIPFILVLGITAATIMVLPPVYRSTGTILVESQQIPQSMIESTVTSFATERIEIIKQRIMTSQQLFDIIKKFDLYANEINSTPRTQILEDMRERITVGNVTAKLSGGRRGPSALIAFTVSFEHRVPAVAQKVANELVTLFLDENIRSRTARAEETTDFLKKEGERLRVEIERMELQIADFEQENRESLPETLRLNIERLVDLKAALSGRRMSCWNWRIARSCCRSNCKLSSTPLKEKAPSKGSVPSSASKNRSWRTCKTSTSVSRRDTAPNTLT